MKRKKSKKYINRISVFRLSSDQRNALWVALDVFTATHSDHPAGPELRLVSSLSDRLFSMQSAPDGADLGLSPSEVEISSRALSLAVSHLGDKLASLHGDSPAFCRLRSELIEYAPYMQALDQVFSRCLNDLLIPSKIDSQ